MNIVDKYLTLYKVVLIKDNFEIELFASYSKSVAITKAKHLSNQHSWSNRYNLTSGDTYKIQVLDNHKKVYLEKSYIVR